MAAGNTPCGIAIPQVFSDTPVDIKLIQNFVQKAETLGYDSLWVQEAIVGKVPVLEPISLLTYAAALTSRPRLGTNDRHRAERRLREWFGIRYRSADMGSQCGVWGSAAACTEKLAAIVRAGAQHLLLNPMFDDMEHLELLAQEVVPQL